jgi:hypothetical protein
MPDIDDAAIALSEKPAREARRIRLVRSAAIVLALSAWLGACAPSEPAAPAPLTSPSPPITVTPLPGPNPPVAANPSTGPIALAPSMTGAPATAPPPKPTPPATAEPPAPTAVASPAPAPPPASAQPVASPPPPVSTQPAGDSTAAAAIGPCPSGTIAVWSEPDLAGTPVAICRRLRPPPR